MRKTFNKYLKTLVSAVMLLSTQAIVLPASAWGPERPTYTNDSPADYATFNSITDNAAVGDERNFVRVRELGTDDNFTDELEIVPGKEYEVYIYYHNNAGTNTNESGFGIATNTRVASAYPTLVTPGEKGMVSGIISWSYVTPSEPNNPKTGTVWDEAYLSTKSEGVVLRYKTGTAIIHNGGAANGSVLPTALFTEEGTPIGYNKLAGTIPGCAEYSGHITYTLVAEETGTSLEKQVSADGQNWGENASIKAGEFATYKVEFKNTGNTTLTNVIFKDIHDEGLSLRSGSTKIFDVNNVEGKTIDDILDLSGYNVGDVAPGALVQVTYQLRVAEDADCGKNLKNTIEVTYNSGEKITNDATVTVDGDCTPTPTPDCTTNPELPECQRIPDTGPVEIIMATIVVLGLCGAGFYFWRTQRALKTVENKVSGKTPEAPKAPEAKPAKEAEPKAEEAKK